MGTFAAPTRRRAMRVNGMSGIAVSGKIPEKHLLGRLAFYSLPDEEVSGAKLMRSWASNGLDPDSLPEARQPVHVFQSACASVQQRSAQNHHGQRIQILANEVKNVGHVCSYQITIRRWAGEVIEHDKTMTVSFDKRTNAVTVSELDHFDKEWANIATAIEDHFDANAKTVPGQKVRNAIRQTLVDIGAQNLRRKAGGLYFVPKDQPNAAAVATLPVLEGLAGVLADLYGDRADFHIIKYANDEGEREIVRKHFALNANEKARELAEKAINRVRQGRGERGVRSDLLANLTNERRALLGQVKQFEKLVNIERSDVSDSLAELDEAMDKLEALASEPAPTK